MCKMIDIYLPMTIEQARLVAQNSNASAEDLMKACITLDTSEYFGDFATAHEIRKRLFFKDKLGN